MFNPTTRILIVDDLATMRKIIRHSLAELGLSEIVEASNGGVAWDSLNNQRTPVGLVISDWNMPNMTGLDLLKLVRSSEKFKQLPFMLVTSEAEAGQVKDALVAGVDGYVVKPFTLDMFHRKLRETYLRVAARTK